MKFGTQKTLILIVALLLAVPTAASANRGQKSPKYVFFFLGDGMSATQIQATEAYLTTFNGGDATVATDLAQSGNRLNMTQMPAAGMQMTYDSFALMTDSASSATAFSCGLKTQSGTIGMDAAKTMNFKSVAQLAKEQGKKVGVISSVSLNHATPAAMYAQVPSRNDYKDIALQAALSGYDFFGGGAFHKTDEETDAAFEAAGYTIVNTFDGIMDLYENPIDKVIASNPVLQDSNAMPYAIDTSNVDRFADNLTLAEITDVAISVLSAQPKQQSEWHWGWHPWTKRKQHKQDNGFFLFVEGGKIDWAGHANDAMANIGDMLDFDDAVGVALDFYNQYPDDTLIVVTGDHETGGMTIGHATTGYSAHYETLLGQNMSFTEFGISVLSAHKAEFGGANFTSLESNSVAQDIMLAYFGLDYSTLNGYQQEKLNDAYQKSMTGANGNSTDENKWLYAGYDPFTVTITHVLNENASIGWTSYSHTGVPVPLFATGVKADAFNGFYDNTDIAKKIASIMGIRQQLPIAE
ncbi:MAG: alkaline phosphatase [Deltaproteobacteria bacterium]|nr:alkaline phosphatase [Deltaproteobacteria bacterium]